MENFKIFQDFWKNFIVQACGRNLFKTNLCLLFLNGDNFHVTLKVLHKARNVVLDLITLPSHMSHALQPFDVACFKPFKSPLGLIRMFKLWLTKLKGLERKTYLNGCLWFSKRH
jgi:hypothetical protein